MTKLIVKVTKSLKQILDNASYHLESVKDRLEQQGAVSSASVRKSLANISRAGLFYINFNNCIDTGEIPYQPRGLFEGLVYSEKKAREIFLENKEHILQGPVGWSLSQNAELLEKIVEELECRLPIIPVQKDDDIIFTPVTKIKDNNMVHYSMYLLETARQDLEARNEIAQQIESAFPYNQRNDIRDYIGSYIVGTLHQHHMKALLDKKMSVKDLEPKIKTSVAAVLEHLASDGLIWIRRKLGIITDIKLLSPKKDTFKEAREYAVAVAINL